MEIDFESLKKALHDLGDWSVHVHERAWSKFAYSDEFATALLAQLALNQPNLTAPQEELVRKMQAPAPSDTTFTRHELAQALARAGFYSASKGASKAAIDIVNDIVAHREPEWEEGAVVQAQNGVVYRRHNGTWLRFGFAGNVRHDIPLRPLKHLGKDHG